MKKALISSNVLLFSYDGNKLIGLIGERILIEGMETIIFDYLTMEYLLGMNSSLRALEDLEYLC